MISFPSAPQNGGAGFEYPKIVPTPSPIAVPGLNAPKSKTTFSRSTSEHSSQKPIWMGTEGRISRPVARKGRIETKIDHSGPDHNPPKSNTAFSRPSRRPLTVPRKLRLRQSSEGALSQLQIVLICSVAILSTEKSAQMLKHKQNRYNNLSIRGLAGRQGLIKSSRF